MKKIILIVSCLLLAFFLMGCVKSEKINPASDPDPNPTAEDILGLDKNADLFQWDGLIYVTDIDWVDELEVNKKEDLGEIKEVYAGQDPSIFQNGMATKLPVGAKVFSIEEYGNILIVEFAGQTKRYLSLVEG